MTTKGSLMLDLHSAAFGYVMVDPDGELTPLAELFPDADPPPTIRPAFDYVPDDVNAVPTIVMGFPELETDFETGGALFDIEQQIFVVGNRQLTRTHQQQLMTYAESVVALFGGSSAISIPSGHWDWDAEGDPPAPSFVPDPEGGEIAVHVTSCRPRQLAIGDKTYNTYDVQIQATGTLLKE